MNVRIERLTTADASIVFGWVVRLLRELGEEEKELGELAHARVLEAWSRRADQFYVLAAKGDGGQIHAPLLRVDRLRVHRAEAEEADLALAALELDDDLVMDAPVAVANAEPRTRSFKPIRHVAFEAAAHFVAGIGTTRAADAVESRPCFRSERG